MIKAVIFDMDGVITRTEAIQSGAESQVFATIGIHITPEEIINSYSGWKDTEMFKDMAKRHLIKDIEKLRKKKWEIVYKKLSDKSIPLVPGSLDLIEKLQKHGYPLALASSTNQKFISIILSSLSIKEKFSAVVSGDEVKQGKPNPEIFLLTSKKLGISSSDCLVIEDAPSGIKAAKAAGMKCIAIATSVTKDKLQNADRVISAFDELSIEDIKNL
ncbi:HAD family phosphatase [Candidatus Microgenomates bacterium]|nr:HAD family phosphatase [Candidatus Microgenomates bacterium]